MRFPSPQIAFRASVWLALTCVTTIAATPIAERKLPEVLTLKAGETVTSAQQWPARRAELLEAFRTNVYGRAPLTRPADLSFKVEKTDPKAMGGAATLKEVAIEFSGPGGKAVIHLVLFVPNQRAEKAPTFLLICNRPPANIDPSRKEQSGFWPAEQIVAGGYAAAAFHVADIDPDQDDGFKNGVHGIFDSAVRADDAWGTIAAWAWGASRVLDYLVTDPDLDSNRVAVVGHSRGGKTALWAGAEDPRFAMVVSNNSGCTGAALNRGKTGESIAVINRAFPHWFCQNYKAFAGRETDLPIDQHELLALIAPRPLYIASATLDDWADPTSELFSGVAASSVYRLFDRPGLSASELPLPEHPLQDGWIGYHLRTGKHDLTPYDWAQFIQFADGKGMKPGK